ncbi:MAG: AI-2E family transporter [Halothiobacillus sp. 14-56-357]|jgi:predicted PurR-regulated permease PerM|uniref:AI-2E family transporter n=1 Tax=Halothiobacillus sp. 15-55-196 TaxID=1970382 RepID=UPI000BC9467F|nr:AI-2E family transporter [Halothiobacillus sp. 15-55-196]OZB37770.1 MAG: AI-2E family transporter [Halothiobacillus sp. 15-55-196]OZB57413.1 MAG: AI-2E family transporter [Halothiobacillus sp. 14-56-357]OZB78252.1 MAG: AI-2E family transporter [Halothiobacillus sp. 13-55-115]
MRWIVIGSLALAMYIVYLLLPILTPFLAGAVLAYLFDPLVTRMVGWKINRTLGTTVVFFVIMLVMILAVLALVPVIINQAVKLVTVFPKLLSMLQNQLVPYINANLGLDINLNSVTQLTVQHAQEIGTVLAKSATVVFGNGSAVVLSLMNLILIPVIGFYLLRDWPQLLQKIRALMPRRQEPQWVALAQESNQMLGGFLRGQLAVMLANGITYAIGLTIVGLETGVVIGMAAGMLSFVPYLGNVIGIMTALIAMYIQTGEFTPLLWVLLVFVIGQTLESILWQPRFVGERIGLHPVAVIFAVMAGGVLFGFFGVLLALPVSAILVVLGRHALKRYRESPFYEDADKVKTLLAPFKDNVAEKSE